MQPLVVIFAFVIYRLECNEEVLSKGMAQWLLVTQLKQLSEIFMH